MILKILLKGASAAGNETTIDYSTFNFVYQKVHVNKRTPLLPIYHPYKEEPALTLVSIDQFDHLLGISDRIGLLVAM